MAMGFALQAGDSKSWQDLGLDIEAGLAARVTRLGGSLLGQGRILLPAAGPDGFEIQLQDGDQGVTGNFGGLVQDFSSLEEALNWAERTFTEDYRLRIDCVGKKPWRWALEKRTQLGGVVELFASGHFVLLRSLRKLSVAYRCNFGGISDIWH